MKKVKLTPEKVALLGKIPAGAIAVFNNGKSVELSGPPLGNGEKASVLGNNFEKFTNPVTKNQDTIGVTGPFITNTIGNDIKGLTHFMVSAEVAALASS